MIGCWNGSKEKNPLDNLWFYRKLSPNVATKATQEQVHSDHYNILWYSMYLYFVQRSHMFPKVFQEFEYRVYCKSKDERIIEAIRRYI